MHLLSADLRGFSQMLADKTPTPGGGGASAYVGALAASLAGMVANYSNRGEKAEQLRPLMEEADSLRVRLLALVDGDAEAFAPLARAYSIPKDDPNREEITEKCLKEAAKVPMNILRLSCWVIDLHQKLETIGSPAILSDVGTGVIFAWAALYGGLLNVKVNTAAMTDRAYAATLNKEAEELADKYWKIAEEVYKKVLGRYSA